MKCFRSELLRWGAAAGVIAAVSTPLTAQAQNAPLALEEIVVTATRREEGLQNVPIAVTAITSEDLATRDIKDYSTYLATVPGAAYQETTGIGGEIKFRGVGTGITAQMSPTTAVYFGDVPVIHTGRNVNSSYNFYLSDMERIEVLRGPQGQLFGSNSLGGAIRNIPAQPILGEYDGAAEVGAATVADGDNDQSVQAMANIPLGDAAALRLVGYTAHQAGWYDNTFRGGPELQTLVRPLGSPPGPGMGLPAILMLEPRAATYAAPVPGGDLSDTNSVETAGGRAILRWQPSDAFNASLTVAYEEKEYGGASFLEWPTGQFGPFENPNLQLDPREYEHWEAATSGGGDEIKLASLTLDYDFGGAVLTSNTSFWERDEQLDLSFSISAITITGQPESVPLANYRSDNPEVFTQEFRLTSNTEGRVDWLAGLFYQEIDQDHRIVSRDLSGLDLAYWNQVVLSMFGPPGTPAPTTRVVADNRSNYVDEQLAVFGQLGFDFTDQWRAAVSFRWFTVDQSFEATTDGFQFGLAGGAQSGENDEDVFTPRLELTYKPSDAQMYYATASEGFRTGVINRSLPQQTCGQELANVGYPDGVPPSESDTVFNYELGAKLDLADGRVRLNTAAYYIDWQDVQLNVPLSAFFVPDPSLPPQIPQQSSCFYDVILNVGDATSMGAELEFLAKMTESFSTDISVSYVDSEFDQSIPQLFIQEGDSMPMQPDVTAFVGLQWGFDLGARPAYLRGEWQYVGEKEPFSVDYPNDDAPFTIGDYSQYNLRAGVDLTDAVSLRLFVDNLTDEFGITSANSTGGLGYPFVTTIRPRTYGASLRVQF